MESRELIEAVRARIAKVRGEKTASDYAVAKQIGISKQAISDHKHGRSFTLSDEAVIRAAAFIGVNEAYALASIHAERSKTDEAKNAWERIATSFRKRAAAASVAFCIMFAPLPSQNAYATSHDGQERQTSVCYDKWLLRVLARLFGGLTRRFRWLLPPFLILAALSTNTTRRSWSMLRRVREEIQGSVMRWIATGTITLALCTAPAMASDDWTRADTERQAVYYVFHVLDWAQTRYIANHPDEFSERNYMIGFRHGPGNEAYNRHRADKYFATTAVIHYLVAQALTPDARRHFQFITIGVEAGLVGYNLNAGVQFQF